MNMTLETSRWKGHYGCVNALALQPNQSVLLASGGDDKRILLWNTYESPINQKPVLAFNSIHQDDKLYCASLDGLASQIDYKTGGGRTLRSFNKHSGSVGRVACSPVDKNVICTVGSDAKAIIWDCRSRGEEATVITMESQLMAVQFKTDNLLAIGGDKGAFRLLDLRQPHASVYERTLRIQTPTGVRSPHITSVDFHGDRCLLSCQTFLSVILDVHTEENRLIVLHDPRYRNLSTVKSMVFSPDGEYAFCGSDNHKIFKFRVVNPLDCIDESTNQTTIQEDSIYRNQQYIDFNETSIIQKAEEVIGGHLSNANNVLCHPELPYLYSSGVEKAVVCHSPYNHGSGVPDQPDMLQSARRMIIMGLPGRVFVAPSAPPHPSEFESTQEDPNTLMMFELLNAEAEGLYEQGVYSDFSSDGDDE